MEEKLLKKRPYDLNFTGKLSSTANAVRKHVGEGIRSRWQSLEHLFLGGTPKWNKIRMEIGLPPKCEWKWGFCTSCGFRADVRFRVAPQFDWHYCCLDHYRAQLEDETHEIEPL